MHSHGYISDPIVGAYSTPQNPLAGNPLPKSSTPAIGPLVLRWQNSIDPLAPLLATRTLVYQPMCKQQSRLRFGFCDHCAR